MRLLPLRLGRTLAAILIVALGFAAGCAPSDFQAAPMASAIGYLTQADACSVQDAIQLTRQGDSELALVRLDNGSQGSLQVWTAWALLHVGTRLGAFEAGQYHRDTRSRA